MKLHLCGYRVWRRVGYTLLFVAIALSLPLLWQRGRRTSQAVAPGLSLPPIGVEMGQSLGQVGIHVDQMSAPYGILLFVGDDALGYREPILRACDSLKKSGFDVYLFLPAKDTSGAWGRASTAVRYDPKGDNRAAFGIQRSGSGLLVFQRTGALCWGRSSGLLPERLAREAMSWTARAGAGGPPDSSRAAPSAVSAAVGAFPFDSLATHGARSEIDLDRVATATLQVLQRVGDKEEPAPGEPLFSHPTDMTLDQRGRLLVVDSDEKVVHVLSREGKLIGRLGGPGQGPGELTRPMAVACNEKGVLIAEACCALHQFDPNLVYRRTIAWPVEGRGLGKWFVMLSGAAVVVQHPLPPAREQVVHLWEITGPQAYPVAGFLPYAGPKRHFRDPHEEFAAVFSRNIVTLASDGRRFLAAYRASERHVTVWDLQTRTARNYALRGRKVRTEVDRTHAPGLPPYAVVPVVNGMAVTPDGKILCLVRGYGLLSIDAIFGSPICLYTQDAEQEHLRTLAYYSGVEASNDRVYLLSPAIPQLAICSLPVEGRSR
ncbi:MAG: hypothetical protein ONB30_12320 [candidate division KSB1 bacterium]|nr:hypothetical protein [candidate division KSB1 bacterium]